MTVANQSKADRAFERSQGATSTLKVLFLAPQPFFQERGTPIAVRALLEALMKERDDITIDLLTFHEGTTIEIPKVSAHRIGIPSFLKGFLRDIRPGASLKKVWCDLFFLMAAFRLAKNAARQGTPYSLVHAVEEGIVVAWLLKIIYRIPYIYDMDSSLVRQLVEKWPVLRLIHRPLDILEGHFLCGALRVIAVCPALVESSRARGAAHVDLLQDFSLLEENPASEEDLRKTIEVPPHTPVVLYVGNLESYQGIDLLLHAWALAPRSGVLVIVGGNHTDIAHYRKKASAYLSAHSSASATLTTSLPRHPPHKEALSKSDSSTVFFLGPRPVPALGSLLKQATSLISPRTAGNNTPMKIYSYLDAGKPIIATTIESHTQVLDDECALLVPPLPEAVSSAITRILTDELLQHTLGTNAKLRAELRHSRAVFCRTVNKIYDEVGVMLNSVAHESSP